MTEKDVYSFWDWMRDKVEARDIGMLLLLILGFVLVTFLFKCDKDALATQLLTGILSGAGAYGLGRPNSKTKGEVEDGE